MSSEVASLKAEFQKLLAEVKALRAEAATSTGDGWGKGHTAIGHPDRTIFPDHPGVNPEQTSLTGKQLEDMVLAHEAKLNGGGSK